MCTFWEGYFYFFWLDPARAKVEAWCGATLFPGGCEWCQRAVAGQDNWKILQVMERYWDFKKQTGKNPGCLFFLHLLSYHVGFEGRIGQEKYVPNSSFQNGRCYSFGIGFRIRKNWIFLGCKKRMLSTSASDTTLMTSLDYLILMIKDRWI